jgi:hypothetical protein
MKKFIWILFIGCLIHSTLTAQSNIIPGYIITTNKDSLKGDILYTSESEMAQAVKFRKEGSTTFSEYHIMDLLGFGMEQEKYSRKNFINSAEDSVRVTAFLKLLVIGEYSLYSYAGPERKFYLLQKDTVSYFLYDYVNQSDVNDLHRANYHNYLSFVTLNCEQAHRLAENVEYNERALSDIVLKLDNCDSSGQAKVYYQKPKTAIQPIIFAGALPFGGNDQQYTAGLTMKFTLPRLEKHASLNIGVNYSYIYKPLSYDILAGITRDVYTKAYIFSIPLTFQYNFTTSRIQPYIYVGFSGTYIDKQPEQTLGYYSPHPEKSSGFSLVAGIGIEARVVSGLYIKADWRYDLFLQLPVVGVSYHF